MGFNGHIPDVQLYWPRVVSLLILFGVFDVLVARHTKARYFSIHVLANSIVVISALPGCFFLLSDPVAALRSEYFSPMAISANLCIHLYHMMAFNDLIWLDWLHHITMTIILMPITVVYDCYFGPVCDMINFLACGLPGGTDYAMIVAVKHGWMASLSEKKYNTAINNWFRAPGIVFTMGMAYTQAFIKDPNASFLDPFLYIQFFVVVLFIWNAHYFLERVVGNYYVRLYQEKQKQKPNGDAAK